MDTTMLPERMQTKVKVHPISECWEWQGSRNPKGYGSVANGRGGSMLAHRKAYEHIVGPIPEGLTIDHLCLNTSCVNPGHMEPVTVAENNRRQIRGRIYYTTAPKPWVQSASYAAVFDRFFSRA